MCWGGGGGGGGAAGTAVGALLGLERALKKKLSGPERLRIAAEVGSDLPLFLVGGTCLGVGRGEEVYPLQDLPSVACVIATPQVAVSTPQAFRDWNSMMSPQERKPVSVGGLNGRAEGVPYPKLQSSSRKASKLTALNPSDRMNEFSRIVSSWLSESALSGVSTRGGGRAETPL